VLRRLPVLAVAIAMFAPAAALAQDRDPEGDILVTFRNSSAQALVTNAPYRARKRYTISAEAHRHADSIANEYGLRQVAHWPIRSLSVYCFVYRIAAGSDRDRIIEALGKDSRVESVQPLNVFETSVAAGDGYDDTYAELQHGLDSLDLTRAHRYSRGKGVRIAVIDSNADTRHEDLKGRVRRIEDFAGGSADIDRNHGTAVTSVIVARTNNARGMVGVAPEAKLELYVACWSQEDFETAVCDSFTLAQALDTLLERPPDVLNLSLAGPEDGLLRRLLLAAHDRGVVLIAARPQDADGSLQFPANMDEVIAVSSSRSGIAEPGNSVFAPGDQILDAVPDDSYDFRSGSSLAAAHVSGVVALVLAISPQSDTRAIQSVLLQSQAGTVDGRVSVNACTALRIADPSLGCESQALRR
jgi:subtilisin family serine protease